MNYSELISLSNVLGKLQDRKVPFSLTITKLTKRVEELMKKYDEERISIVQKFASVDENGNLLGKVGEDGNRIQNPQTLDQLDVDDMNGLIKALNDLTTSEVVDFAVEPIDLAKTYYNSELKEKSTVEEFIDTNFEPGLIAAMESVGLLKF